MRAYGVATGILLVAMLAIDPPSNIWALWKLIAASAGAIGSFVAIVGQPGIFPRICRLPGLRRLVPDLDGAWVGEIRSNWPIFERRLQQPTSTPANGDLPALINATQIGVVFRVSLFWIVMTLRSDTGYSSSRTSFVLLRRDRETGSISLQYIYDNVTNRPLPTDSSSHKGAACLDLLPDRDGFRLEGVYWTNRNWQHGLNTAGTVVLRREIALDER